MINVFFLILYVFLSDLFSATDLSYILSLHCIICGILHIKANKTRIVTPLFIFYIGIMLINYANISIINLNMHGELKGNMYLAPKYINDAVKIWCVSTTLVIIGYRSNIKKSLPSIAFQITNRHFYKYLFWTLILVNLKIFSSGLGSIPFPAIFKLLNVFSILFFARLWTKENNTTFKWYAIVLYLLVTFVSLRTAFLRLDLILPSFSFFAGYFVGKGSLKYVFTYRIVPFLIILVTYSYFFKKFQSNRSNFYAVIFEDEQSGLVNQTTESSGTGLLERGSNLQQLTSCLKLVNQNGFYNGVASEPLVAAVIPRFLWPDKPKVQLGVWFANEISGWRNSKNSLSNNSINMTIPGELYLDFGWVGVIIGSILLGMLFPLFWNATQFYASENNLAGIIYGGYLLLLSISGFGGDLQIIISLMSLYLTFYIVKRLAKNL